MNFGVRIKKVEINEKKNITYKGSKWLYVGTIHKLETKTEIYVNSTPRVRDDYDYGYVYDILEIRKDRLLLRLLFENAGTSYASNLHCILTQKKVDECEILFAATYWLRNIKTTGKVLGYEIGELLNGKNQIRQQGI